MSWKFRIQMKVVTRIRRQEGPTEGPHAHKLAVVLRAASWLADDGQFVANLDLNNIKLAVGRVASRVVAKELRQVGLEYDSRRKLVHCSRRIEAQLPFRYCGADDQAGPNYTRQPAVDSYYGFEVGSPM